jgi:8-oxo-dGTP pyrophosphatase MutT (NUDIX family)
MPSCTYESAGGVVVSGADELVLVLIRSKRLGPDDRPEVRLPKGHIEPGESRRDAAIREVREESGLAHLEILSDLGHQRVEFTWRGTSYLRNESYYLMTIPSNIEHDKAEAQFERRWLPWKDALTHLTFEAEKEWVRRARIAWNSRLQDVSEKDPKQANDHTQV